MGGWILTPIDANNTHCVNIVYSDPKGNIPSGIKSWAAKQQAYCVERLRKAMNKKK